MTSDDKYIITGSADKSVKVFDLQKREDVYHFQEAHERKRFCVPMLLIIIR